MKTTTAQKKVSKLKLEKEKDASAYYAIRDGMSKDTKKYVEQFIKKKGKENED